MEGHDGEHDANAPAGSVQEGWSKKMPKDASPEDAGLMEHPELEDLAAYIDGMLPPDERARVAEHLDSCPQCYEVFAETVRLQAEEPAAVDPPSGVTPAPLPFRDTERRLPPPPRPRGWSGAMRPLASLAAAALVGMVGFGLYRAFVAAPEISTPALAESLGGNLPNLAKLVEDPNVMRGGNQQPGPFPAQSFLLGALDVDLYLSLQQNEHKSTSELCRRIASLLKQLALDEDAKDFWDCRKSPDTAPLPPDVRDRMDKALALLDEVVSPFYLDLGRFTEAGRIAALERRQEFFESRSNRRVLELLLTNPDRLAGEDDEEIVLEPDVKTHLQEVQSLWSANRGDAELKQIATSLGSIVKFYGDQSLDDGSLAPP